MEGTPGLIDLSMPVTAGMAVLPGHAHTCVYRTSEHQAMADFGSPTTFAIEGLLMSTHEGTHVDTPLHCDPEGADVANMPLEAFAGPGICVDLVGVAAESLISRAVLEAALGKQDLTIPPNGYVLLRTGHWERSYGTRSWFRHNGLDREAAVWLAGRGISGVGIDAPSIDSSREYRRGEYPAHRALLVESSVLVVENLVHLERVAGRAFTYWGWPLLLPGCGGSPIRAVAQLRALPLETAPTMV